jgi:hypothetical protein
MLSKNRDAAIRVRTQLLSVAALVAAPLPILAQETAPAEGAQL